MRTPWAAHLACNAVAASKSLRQKHKLRVRFHSRRLNSTTASVCRTPPAYSLAEAHADDASSSVTISTEAELRAAIHNHPLDTEQECRANAAGAFPVIPSFNDSAGEH